MKSIKSPSADKEKRLSFLVQILARDIDAKMKAKLKERQTDVKLFQSLTLLSQRDGINQRTLAKKLQLPDYITSRKVNALVKAEYVRRDLDPTNRRAHVLYLTNAGKARLLELNEAAKGIDCLYLNALANEDKEILMELLIKISEK
ncbi:MarR family winged helix-turn-helix transcriptional regulator [Pseudovibrio brasiliensis]|uniref:MarR family transcriptional regulator n=1 Tax=Pseudovibrio brasiliensis TaxID=1898042 RepID=A0ABX8APT6_9HYPH|nr:MarR family transcriptional regulator [Pseudovibrio brasiliensis]QUS57119.1 MarR family transcriptional regulator [Pseudovibrio brasiliensis]